MRAIHVESYDFSLRIITIAIILARGIEEILDPEDVTKSSTQSDGGIMLSTGSASPIGNLSYQS